MPLGASLGRVLTEYPSARQGELTDHPLAAHISHDLRDELAGLVDDSYKVTGSPGRGNWAETPWVAVFDPLVTETAQRGFYVVYLFRGDGGAVYLSLNQGTTEVYDLVGLGARAIDPATPLADLARLRDGTASVREWVSNEVAHYNKNTGEFSSGLTFGDVHAAMDLIFEIYNRYNQLILGTTTAGSVTMPPWEHVFTVPWIPSEEDYVRVAQTQRETDNRRM